MGCFKIEKMKRYCYHPPDECVLTELISVQFLMLGKKEFSGPSLHYVRITLVNEFCQFLANCIGTEIKVTFPLDSEKKEQIFNPE